MAMQASTFLPNFPFLVDFDWTSRKPLSKRLHGSVQRGYGPKLNCGHASLPVLSLKTRGYARNTIACKAHSGKGGGDGAGRKAVLEEEVSASAANFSSPVQQQQWRWEDSEDAVVAYGAILGVLACGLLLQLTSLPLVDLGYFLGLALTTIYIGAHRGLSSKIRRQISFKEGLLAPLLLSASLLAVYLLVKLLPDLKLQVVLDAYFWFLGCVALGGGLLSPAKQLGGRLGQPSWRVPVPQGLLMDEDGSTVEDVMLAVSDVCVVLLAVCVATLDLQAGHTNFTLNNMLACFIAADILQLVGLRSFRTAAVMLVGLLMYDVFWVFGSPQVIGENVMLTVATSDVLVGPTRLLFPKLGGGGGGEAAFFPFSLLGLGDVAVPGLLACLALRYDASRATDMRSRAIAAADAITSTLQGLEPDASPREVADATAAAADAAYDGVADLEAEQRRRALAPSSADNLRESTVFNPSDAVLCQRTYFTPVLVAYVLGLGAAFAANTVTRMGQPALLYLVPATLLALLLTAATRNEISKLVAFTDTPSTGIIRKE